MNWGDAIQAQAGVIFGLKHPVLDICIPRCESVLDYISALAERAYKLYGPMFSVAVFWHVQIIKPQLDVFCCEKVSQASFRQREPGFGNFIYDELFDIFTALFFSAKDFKIRVAIRVISVAGGINYLG